MTGGSHRICLKLWLVKLLFTKLVYPYTAPRVQQLADIYKYFLKFILQNSIFFLKYISINSQETILTWARLSSGYITTDLHKSFL